MEFARYWRSRLGGSWQLWGSNCNRCGKEHFPSRDVCPDCGYRGAQIERKPEIIGGAATTVGLVEIEIREDGGNGKH